MDRENEDAPSTLAYLFLMMMGGIAADLWLVYVGWCYWFWFLVPLGVFEIPYWHLAGLHLGRGFFIRSKSGVTPDDVSAHVSHAFAMLGFGYICHILLLRSLS